MTLSPPTYTWKLHNLGFRISAIYWKKQFWSKLSKVVGFLCQPNYNNRHYYWSLSNIRASKLSLSTLFFSPLIVEPSSPLILLDNAFATKFFLPFLYKIWCVNPMSVVNSFLCIGVWIFCYKICFKLPWLILIMNWSSSNYHPYGHILLFINW